VRGCERVNEAENTRASAGAQGICGCVTQLRVGLGHWLGCGGCSCSHGVCTLPDHFVAHELSQQEAWQEV
jgi:hypothetical protein